jgi:hypothetical protein
MSIRLLWWVSGIPDNQKRVAGKTHSRNNGILPALFFILVAAFQGNAVLNKKWVTAEADTVYLDQNEIREYYVNKNVGEDLSNAALLLSVAAIPAFYASMSYAASGPGREYNRTSLVKNVFSEGVFPFCALVMAIGNIQYAQAARKDPYAESSITSSWLPYFVSAASLVSFSMLANRILFTECYHTTGFIEDYEKCEEVPSGSIVGASTLITIPWMRYQFRKSRLRLDGLEIRPGRESQKVSVWLGF